MCAGNDNEILKNDALIFASVVPPKVPYPSAGYVGSGAKCVYRQGRPLQRVYLFLSRALMTSSRPALHKLVAAVHADKINRLPTFTPRHCIG